MSWRRTVLPLVLAAPIAGATGALVALGVDDDPPNVDRLPTFSGSYVLVDSGDECPQATVLVNAELPVRTNAQSGTSMFTLCRVK